MLLPIGHDSGSVRRQPWITYVLMAACVGVFLITNAQKADLERQHERRVLDVIEHIAEHPYLEPPESLGTLLGPDAAPNGGTGRKSGRGDDSGNPFGTFSAGMRAVFPFATGGVVGAPSYFPLAGGLGLAGEAGPEAIVPLTRGNDGRLGVAMNGAGQGGNITVHIVTPDPESFRRSETYITGQIARAVARGQRGF